MSIKTKTLAKVDVILNCFTPDTPSWSATLLSKKLKIPVTTMHGILADLVTLDFLAQDPQTKEYKIGFRYMEMGALHSNNFELNNIAHGMMRELTLKVDHLVGLSVLYKGWMYVSMSILPFERASGFRYAGSKYPAHLTAGGMAILAQLTPDEIKRYCAMDWEKARFGSLSLDTLEKQLQIVRQRGYAVPCVDESSELPIRSIGAPIFGRDREVLAGLVIIGPYEGFSKEELSQYSRSVIDTANEISQRSARLYSSSNAV